jgi:hypothetical protein
MPGPVRLFDNKHMPPQYVIDFLAPNAADSEDDSETGFGLSLPKAWLQDTLFMLPVDGLASGGGVEEEPEIRQVAPRLWAELDF